MSETDPLRVSARLRLALRADRTLGLRSLLIRVKTTLLDRSVGAEVSPSPAVRTPAVRENISPPASATKNITVPARPPRTGVISPLFSSDDAVIELPMHGFDSPVLPRDEKIIRLQTLDEKNVSVCRKCQLHQTRTHTAFGEGDPDAQIMFIGEGPGENEDLQGRPFVGRAGELLDKMIVAMGLSRPDVYICNIIKCRPPNNRQPSTVETAACTPYLLEQIEVVRPKIIVSLGLPATQYLLQTKSPMGQMRGQWREWRGIWLMPTYHPAYVLRQYNVETRSAVWRDLKEVMKRLESLSQAPN